MLRIALLLCGCGNLDGSDPVQTLALRIAAARAGDLLFPLAPDRDQADVIGLQGPLAGERRSAFAESSRLTDGRLDRLESAHADEFDVLAVPGGLGVVKTLAAGEPPLGSDLLHGVLAGRGALLLLDEGAAWAARAHRARDGESAWRLAAGEDPLLTDAITAAGHLACGEAGIWVEESRLPIHSIVFGGSPSPDRVVDACAEGLERIRARLTSRGADA